jgi:hypothetical protein
MKPVANSANTAIVAALCETMEDIFLNRDVPETGGRTGYPQINFSEPEVIVGRLDQIDDLMSLSACRSRGNGDQLQDQSKTLSATPASRYCACEQAR